jgi:hypothetical protein
MNTVKQYSRYRYLSFDSNFSRKYYPIVMNTKAPQTGTTETYGTSDVSAVSHKIVNGLSVEQNLLTEGAMKTKIFFEVAGAEDFVIVAGQLKAAEAQSELREQIHEGKVPAGAEYLDHESQPCVADAQFGL